MALNNLGVRYSEVGRRRRGARRPPKKPSPLYRELAADNPAYLPDLAMALNNLGVRYSELGRRHDALAPTEEAVKLYRGWPPTTPPTCPDLAMALNNLGTCYRAMGRGAEAEEIWEESLDPLATAAKVELIFHRALEQRHGGCRDERFATRQRSHRGRRSSPHRAVARCGPLLPS